MRLSELQKRFGGTIQRDRQNDWYIVTYPGQSRRYRYYAPALWELGLRLGIITDDEAARDKGYAGACPNCGSPYRDENWRCDNCRKLIRQPTKEELRRERERDELWN